MGLAFTTIVLADLSLGLCLYALLAFLNVIPDIGGSFLSFDKVAGGLLALSWMGAVVNAKRERRAFAAAHPLFFGVLVFFLAWAVLSLTWAEQPSIGYEPTVRYLLNAFLFLIVFTAVRVPRHVIWLVGAFVAASTLSAVYGLIVPQSSAEIEGRLGGSLGEPNELAAVLVAGFVLAIALAAVSKGKPLTRVTLFVAAILCLLCNFLTLSRGGLIALGVAMLVAVLVAGRWRAQAFGAAAVSLTCLVVFFGAIATPTQVDRVTTAGTGSGRSDIWTVALRMVSANPVKGVGVGQFRSSARHYVIEPGTIKRTDLLIDTPHVAHNMYLQELTEFGIVGLVAFVLILLFPMVCMLRAAHKFERIGDTRMELVSRAMFVALAGILVADFFLSAQFSKQLWLLLGLGPALLAMASRRDRPDAEPEQDDAVVSPLAPRRLEPAPGLQSSLPAGA
jgi:O-antigen ligase